jgi:hypothetical protein
MTTLEYQIVQGLLSLKWEKDSYGYFFLARLRKWKDRELSLRGRSYLMKIFGSRLNDLPSFHSFEVQLLAEAYGPGIHDLYRVLAAVEVGKHTVKEITTHVWPSGFAKAYLTGKGKNDFKEKVLPIKQYGLSFLTKIVIDGFLVEKNGGFEFAMQGFSLLYLYRLKSDPKELELVSAGEMIVKPKRTFLPFPVKRRTLL